MAKQQISKRVKAVMKGASDAVGGPPRTGERQTRRRRPRAGAGAADMRPVTAAAAVPEAIVDGSAMSTGSGAPLLAVSQSRPKPKRIGAATKSDPVGLPASTKRAMLIGMLERAEGASVSEIGEHLGWLPHTVRAAITGLRHAGREVTRSKDQSGQSVYRLAFIDTHHR